MKYILLNDIYFFLKKVYKKIFLILLIPILISIFYSFLHTEYYRILLIIFGLDLHFNESSIIEIVMYLLNITSCIYISSTLYTKDLKYQLENVFLRESYNKWINYKILIFFMFTFIIKLVQYFLSTLIIFSFGVSINWNYFIVLLLCDCVYSYIVQFAFIILYTLYMSNYNKTILIISIFIVSSFPKRIMFFNNYIILNILIISTELILIKKIIKNNNKKIIEKVGE